VSFGPYQVLGEIGRGGMGVVARARAPDGRDVAIKVLLARGSSEKDADAAARFDRERRLLSSFGEPDGFVPIIDGGLSPNGPYIVMPFVSGGTLRDRLDRGQLEVEEARALGITLAESLGRAHARGVVHRDLKPENVLFTTDGRPLVSDLGLAKHCRRDAPGASRSVSLSRTGEMVGTPGYMAPEQMNDAKSVGPPADVFAIGAIIYECLAGRGAFEGDSVHAVLARVATANVVPLRELRPEVPRSLAKVVARALSSDPAVRFPDGAALALALSQPDSARGRSALVLGAVAALAVAATGAAWGLRSGAPEAQASVAPVASTSPAAAPAHAAESAPTATAAPASLAPASAAAFESLSGPAMKLTSVIGTQKWSMGHAVRAIAWSAGGGRVLCGGETGALALFDPSTGDQLLGFSHPTDASIPVSSVAISPDGKRGLSARRTGVILWDLEHGTVLSTFGAAHMRSNIPRSAVTIRAVALSPDGRTAAAGCEDGGVQILGLGSGSARELEASGWSITTIAFAPDGQVITGGDDGSIRVWNVSTRRSVRLGEAHKGGVTHLVIAKSKGSLVIVSGGRDGCVRVTDLKLGNVLAAFEGHSGAVSSVAVTEDGETIVSGGMDQTVRTWDLSARRTRHVLNAHTDAVSAVAVSPDGTRALSGAYDGSIRVWDLVSGREIGSEVHRGPVTALAVLGEDRTLVSGGLDGTVRFHDLARGTEEFFVRTGSNARIESMALTPKGDRVVTIGRGYHHDLRLWQLTAPPRELRAITGRGFVSIVGSVSVSPDGTAATTSSPEGRLMLWDLNTGRLEEHPARVHARHAKFLPDGRVVAATFESGVVVLEPGKKPLHVDMNTIPEVPFITVGAGGRRAWIGNVDAGIAEIDLETRRELRRVVLKMKLPREGHWPEDLVSPDGRWAVAPTDSGVTRLVDLVTGEVVQEIDLRSQLNDSAASYAFASEKRLFVGTSRGLILGFDILRSRETKAPASVAPVAADQTRALDDPEAASFAAQAEELAKQERLPEAIAALSSAIALAPGNGAFYSRRSGFRKANGDKEGALADCNRAIELDPHLAYAFANRAELCVESGDQDGAFEDASKALAIDDGIASSWAVKGWVLAKRQDWPNALAALDRAIALAPKTGWIRQTRAAIKLATRDWRGALEDARVAHDELPDDIEILTIEARAMIELDDRPGAARTLRRILELAPDHPDKAEIKAKIAELERR
jgi:WD40 repeat protein